MAKIPFSKIDTKIQNDVITKTIIGKNNETIKYEIRTYLPIEEKMNMISNIINQSLNDNGFCNPMAVNLYLTLETIYYYTNFSFTEKQKENPLKLYDIIINKGLFQEVINTINPIEWEEIQKNLWDTINNIYKYNNSAAGVLETIIQNYSNMNLDISELTNKLTDNESLSTLKELLPFINE